jgi:Na+-driven multidrug efflux pump
LDASTVSEHRNFVLTAPLGRTLWSLSWPIAISNELYELTALIVMFSLGHFTGDTGLVVYSLFRPVSGFVLWWFTGISTGSSVLVARSVGAVDGRGLFIASSAVKLTLCMWAVLAAVAIPLAPWLTSLLAGEHATDTPMTGYIIGWFLLALPTLACGEILLDVANATGATRLNLLRVLFDLAIMAALMPLMIEGVGLGVPGAPIAQGLAALGLNAVVWLALVRNRSTLALGEHRAEPWRDRIRVWKEILAIGIPVQIGRVVMFAMQIVYVQLIWRDGRVSTAGYGIAEGLLVLGMMLSLAVAQGTGVMIGQALGARNWQRARDALRVGITGAWIVIGAFVLIVTLFDRQIIGLFTHDPEIVTAAASALALLRWSMFGNATMQILIATFAAHKAVVAASGIMIAGELVGLTVALTWSGSNLQSVGVAMIVASLFKSGLLLGLVATGRLERAREALRTKQEPSGL